VEDSPGKRTRRVVGDLIRLALAVLLGIAIVAAYSTYRIWEQGGHDEQRPAGAIVVLGAAQFDGRPSPVFAARLDHAVQLFLHYEVPYLVVTGGKAQGDRTTEAATARAYAIAHGVAASAILTEDRGRNTLESLQSVAGILRARGISDAVFVSDPTHMLRVLRIAQDLGMKAYGSPTPTSVIEADPSRRLDATIHELAGLGLYFLAREAPAGELATDAR
jgi:uncharacterized SAM-binding protein YcdF (DUF218 family)